jgi:pimeloyl-ACP methyl ester carboxylesterase/DNA-binding CsgD family transcriptional regulator
MGGVKQRLESTRMRDGTEIAYAVSGWGPFLVLAPGWLTHLELGWAMPEERAFYETLSRGRTLVRYDKAGCGLSGASGRAPSMDLETETLEAVVTAVGADRYDLFGASLGAAVAAQWAATAPDAVSRLVLYGGWVRGRDLATDSVREHVLGLVASHWGLGSDVLADIFAPDADATTRAAFVRFQREAADAETARSMLALSYELDVSEYLARVRAPTLVVHRSQDRAVPLDQGQALADGIPGAQMQVLAGRDHLPYVGDVTALASGIREFIGLSRLSPGSTLTLTPRQLQVAELVALGMTNREIASRLTITERSAESHVERIRDRLDFRSRSQIAAWYASGGR